MDESKPKFGIRVDTLRKCAWAFGIRLLHWNKETYLYINFWKWAVLIGKIIK